MSFNLTGFDPDVFAAVNSAVHIVLLSIATLPTLILNVLCAVALLFAKEIHWQVKTTLINIIAAEIVWSIGEAFVSIGYPVRVYDIDEAALSCDIGLSFVISGFVLNASATTLYAITAFAFIKYGKKKLKWYVFVAYIVVSWALYCVPGVLLSSTGGNTSSNGFCMHTSHSIAPMIILLTAGLIFLASVCLVFVFDVLVFYHIRKVVGERNVKVKKAITKLLFYHSLKMFILLLNYIFGAVLSVVRSLESSYTGVIIFLVTQYILLDAIYDITAFLTPILSLIILKPLRDALKQMCSCCKVERPAGRSTNQKPAQADTAV